MPRSRSSLAAAASGREPPQPFGIEGAADADESSRLPGRKLEPIELCGSKAAEMVRKGRRLQAADRVRRCADEPPLDRARLARRDQLADDRAQERVRDRRRADRTQALQVADGACEQLVVAETLEERRVVVVRAEHEAKLCEPGFGLGAEDEPAVRKLACRGSLAVGQHTGEDTVAEPPRRVRCAPSGERERVRAAWPDRRLERHAATLRGATAGPAPAAGARHALGRAASGSENQPGTSRSPFDVKYLHVELEER